MAGLTFRVPVTSQGNPGHFPQGCAPWSPATHGCRSCCCVLALVPVPRTCTPSPPGVRAAAAAGFILVPGERWLQTAFQCTFSTWATSFMRHVQVLALFVLGFLLCLSWKISFHILVENPLFDCLLLIFYWFFFRLILSCRSCLFILDAAPLSDFDFTEFYSSLNQVFSVP